MKNELQPSAAHFLLYKRCVVYTHSTISGIQYKSYQRFP